MSEVVRTSRWDYIQPKPEAIKLDAKLSPLALLAQTCRSIGQGSSPEEETPERQSNETETSSSLSMDGISQEGTTSLIRNVSESSNGTNVQALNQYDFSSSPIKSEIAMCCGPLREDISNTAPSREENHPESSLLTTPMKSTSMHLNCNNGSTRYQGKTKEESAKKNAEERSSGETENIIITGGTEMVDVDLGKETECLASIYNNSWGTKRVNCTPEYSLPTQCCETCQNCVKHCHVATSLGTYSYPIMTHNKIPPVEIHSTFSTPYSNRGKYRLNFPCRNCPFFGSAFHCFHPCERCWHPNFQQSYRLVESTLKENVVSYPFHNVVGDIYPFAAPKLANERFWYPRKRHGGSVLRYYPYQPVRDKFSDMYGEYFRPFATVALTSSSRCNLCNDVLGKYALA